MMGSIFLVNGQPRLLQLLLLSC